MSGTTMKVMLKDMFEFIDAIADIQELHHDESLEKLQKKSNNKFLGFNMFMMMTVMKNIMEEKADMQEFIDEQKVENEKLKAEHKKFDEIWKTEGITEQDIIDMKRQISDQCDLIKKLKEEQGMSKLVHHQNMGLSEDLKRLKEENEKLKEEQGMSKLVHHQNMGLSEDLKRLKEENEKLKAELNDFTSVFDGNVSMIKMKKENEQLKYELADVQEEKYALYLKWSDLNDENKNIKHELDESTDCVVRMIKMKEENEELKQGIKDLFLSFD
tara:strand:+ start:626 stop:1438 length:813 start_codon:yes stop_codon:yes gene_type:complete